MWIDVPETQLTPVASDLRDVIGRLIRRLRAQYRFPMTQAAMLGRLDREGAQYIGELAAAERVRPQSPRRYAASEAAPKNQRP